MAWPQSPHLSREKPHAIGGIWWGGVWSPSLRPPLRAPQTPSPSSRWIARAGGHTEDVTLTRGHILFSGCTCALFLLNSQSFIDSKPSPFSPAPSTLYFLTICNPFPPLDHSSASTLSIISARSLFSQKKPTDNPFKSCFSQEPYKLHAKHCT